MKLSDYVANFLVEQGVKHTFGITGGAIVHVLDSISKNPNITHICTEHEQAAAMAADAYSRITGNLGVGITTSGPGATNLITGVCCSYFDSIPALFITGQVPTSQLKKNSKSRQIGFQETDIVSLFKSITKYCVLIEDPKKIKYELEKAVHIAKIGRPGPVLIDLPDDLQRAEINPSELENYIPEKEEKDFSKLREWVDKTIDLIKNSERPVIIFGNGIKLAQCEERAKNFIENLKFPVALTWATKDMFPYNHSLVIEGFGVSSGRAGNFSIQNSDLIIAIGARLNTLKTGNNLSSFAREAKKVIVDIDSSELEKYELKGMKTDLLINSDVKDFFDIINEKIDRIEKKDILKWTEKINEWKRKYPPCPQEYFFQKEKVNPYVFMDALSKETKEGDIIITDAGANLTWTMQGYRVRKNQKLFSAFNHSPMGYSLPASIGANFAAKKPIICIIGDGGLQMNIQELATVKYHNLPIKIFLFNNHGYGIIQQTQDTWLNSNYVASNSESGVAFPDFIKISESYGIPTLSIKNHNELKEGIKKTLDYNKGPILCNVEIEQHHKIAPKSAPGKPIEDSMPLLDREEFYENMIVKPLD